MSTGSQGAETRGEGGIRDRASAWVVRRDRRLTEAEEQELRAWLEADPRHAAAFEHSLASWQKFRELGQAVRRAPDPRPVAQLGWNWIYSAGLAVAALLVVAFYFFRGARDSAPEVLAVQSAMVPGLQRLSDGSTARLRDGAQIIEAFSPAERRIRLVRGEAFFTVAKNPARPFLVEVGTVTVRAVGTAFSVRFDPRSVNVLVTEGTVKVTPPSLPAASGERANTDGAALVEAGFRAFVDCAPESPGRTVLVRAVTAAEIAASLAWDQPMLELAGATLGELVATFQARSGQRIELADASLRTVQIGGRFPTDDVDGFVRALEEIYDVKSERRSDGVLVLRRAR